MTAIVLVDASVAIKWVVAETESSQAAALLYDAVQAQHRIVGPPHLKSEVINAVYRRTLRGRPEEGQLAFSLAAEAVAAFLSFPLTILEPAELYQQGFQLAHRFGLRTICDSLYIALAVLLEAPLWTADQRLLNSLGPDSPYVRSITLYPTS